MIMHGRSCPTIDPRIPTVPGRSTSGFHRPGRHLLAPSVTMEGGGALSIMHGRSRMTLSSLLTAYGKNGASLWRSFVIT